MRRRVLTAAMAAALATTLATSASAAGWRPSREARFEWVQRYTQWLFGDPESSLLTETCGEVRDGAFFLVPPSAPDQVFDCLVPAGLPIVYTHAVRFEWDDDDPNSRKLVHNARTRFRPGDPSVTLDGREVDQILVRPAAFDVEAAVGSLFDVGFRGIDVGTVRVAVSGLFTFLGPLARGEHVITSYVDFTSVGGPVFDATYHLEVYGLS
ncbi:MAG: hypothetical protein ACKO8G_01510 [Actinomycetota bacterium]